MDDYHSISAALVRAGAGGRGIRAIEHDGQSTSFSYGRLLADALRIAGTLTARGLKPGDRVGVVIPEVSGFIQTFFGIASAGLVPVPLAPPAQAGDIGAFTRHSCHVLGAARASAVVTTGDIAPLLNLSAVPTAPTVLTLNEAAEGTPLLEPIHVPGNAVALLQFTSGSTAAPKGVALTQANIRANVAAIAGSGGLNLTPADVGVSWLPLYHDMGLIGMLLTAVSLGADILIMSPVLFLKRPTAWLETIARHRATVSFAPNFAYELCLRRVKSSQIETLDLSSWRIAGCGAEPIRSSVLEAFADRFASAGFRSRSFVPSYGLAEHTVAVSLSPSGLRVDAVDRNTLVNESRAVAATGPGPAARLVGCGHPLPGHRVRVVDEKGRELPERHVGRILASGPSVMSGYFDDPDATAETLRDGWLHTGDLGYVAEGELFVCGRTRDTIIRQGRKYHPADLESAIADLDDVKVSAVLVFGINHLEEPDEVVAVLEARAGGAGDAVVAQIRRRVRESAGLDLDRIILTPPGTIPRTTSGKLKREETRNRVAAGTLVTSGRTE
jgi:fatty-acyl-CoA synthase